MSVLDAIHARINRANDHVEAVNTFAKTWMKEDFCVFAPESDRKRGRIHIKVAKLDPFPHEYGVMIGDAAHCLRAALDNLAFAIVKPPPSKEKRVYFPIFNSRKAFRDGSPTQLLGVAVRVRAAFERLQPYHRRKQPDAIHLAQLNALSNWDKHRAIAICGTLGVTSNIRIKFLSGPHSVASYRFRKSGRLRVGARLATIQMSRETGESNVHVEPEILVAPGFDEGMPSILQGVEPLRVLIKSKTYITDTVLPELARFI